MENLEKSWNLKIFISTPGKVFEKKKKSKKFWKSHGNEILQQ